MDIRKIKSYICSYFTLIGAIVYSFDMNVFPCLIFQIESEENVLICLRIIIELHKQFRPPISQEVRISAVLFFCLIYLRFSGLKTIMVKDDFLP